MGIIGIIVVACRPNKKLSMQQDQTNCTLREGENRQGQKELESIASQSQSMDLLAKLTALHESGALTEEEYQVRKEKLLEKM